MPPARESIEDKLAKLIDSKFAERDRKAQEEKDPWARLEGMIDRAVTKALDARESKGGRRQQQDDDRGDDRGQDPIKALFG
jgi:hypothetical protein